MVHHKYMKQRDLGYTHLVVLPILTSDFIHVGYKPILVAFMDSEHMLQYIIPINEII